MNKLTVLLLAFILLAAVFPFLRILVLIAWVVFFGVMCFDKPTNGNR